MVEDVERHETDLEMGQSSRQTTPLDLENEFEPPPRPPEEEPPADDPDQELGRFNEEDSPAPAPPDLNMNDLGEDDDLDQEDPPPLPAPLPERNEQDPLPSDSDEGDPPSDSGEHQEHAQRLFSTFFIILTYPHFLGVNSFSSFYEIDDI